MDDSICYQTVAALIVRPCAKIRIRDSLFGFALYGLIYQLLPGILVTVVIGDRKACCNTLKFTVSLYPAWKTVCKYTLYRRDQRGAASGNQVVNTPCIQPGFFQNMVNGAVDLIQ